MKYPSNPLKVKQSPIEGGWDMQCLWSVGHLSFFNIGMAPKLIGPRQKQPNKKQFK